VTVIIQAIAAPAYSLITERNGSCQRRLRQTGDRRSLWKGGREVCRRTPANDSLERDIAEGGTAEQWNKERKLALNWTRLSCHRFRGDEVRLWLSVIAYKLENLWRRSPLFGGLSLFCLAADDTLYYGS
jgi:Transposase DDE domain group 1